MSPVGHDPAVDRLEIRPAKRHQLSCASSRSTFGNRDIGREAFAGQPGLRSELRISSPIGYAWDRYVGLGLDPNRRLQEVIRLVFQKFRELGSARQVLLWMASQNIHFPYPSNGRTLTSFEWRPIRYRNVISICKSYGQSEKRTTIVDGRARKSYGHRRPMGMWEVFIKDHHEGYISWAEFERNQALLAGNAAEAAGGA